MDIDTGVLKSSLREKGWCLITGVLSDEDCRKYSGYYRMWMDKFQGDHFPENEGSIIQKYGIPHMQPTWEVRIKSKGVFESFWGTKKLLSSIDGVSIVPPLGHAIYGNVANFSSLAPRIVQERKRVGMCINN